ncbi:hypothetical protein Tco_0630326 [Tanacetum coccineum]
MSLFHPSSSSNVLDPPSSSHHIDVRLWYPKGTDIETVVYADFDHAGDRRIMWIERSLARLFLRCVWDCCLTLLVLEETNHSCYIHYPKADIGYGVSQRQKACQQAL